MRSLLSVVVSSAVFSFGLVALTSHDARADEPGAAPAPASAPAAAEQPRSSDDADEVKRISLAVNPLGIAIGRYSIQGEYMLAKHHAITLNPFFNRTPVTYTVNGKDIDGGALTGFGGEAGYRLYTGSRGANGFFIGPSFLFASYSSDAPGGASSQSFTSVGGALDLGGQAIIGPGIVIGAGAGLQYTTNSVEISTDNLNAASAAVAGGGIRPRFLLALGYSF
jgi:hypothetical protein